MDLSQTTIPPPDERSDLGDCSFRRRLGPFHDGELDEPSAMLMSDHLRSCAACRAELEDFAELSGSAQQIGGRGISRVKLVAIHKAIDADDRFVLYRFAGVLTAVAASLLVVGGTWLLEVPTGSPGYHHVQVVVDSAKPNQWDSVALGSLQNVPLSRSDVDYREQQMINEMKSTYVMADGFGGNAQ